MDVFEALSALTTTPGVTGNEVAVSEVVKGYYKAYTDDIFIDPMGNTYAHIGDHGPVLLVQAHMDEVGMMVTDIEEDGLLRIRSVAGVDPRVLPGSEVLCTAKGAQCRYGRNSAAPSAIGRQYKALFDRRYGLRYGT